MNLKETLNNKIFKAGSWYTISNFFVKGINFLTIPIFTRILTTDDYGVVSLYNTWVAIFIIIIGLSLNESIRRGKYDYENEYDEFVSSITGLSFLIFGVYIVIFVLFNNVITQLTGLNKYLFSLMIVQSFFAFINELTATKLRFEYKYKTISLINIINSLIGVAFSIFLITSIFDQTRYLGKIVGTATPIILLGMVFSVYLIKKGQTIINFGYWKYAITLSIPLVFHGLSSVANSQFDRIIISKYIGDSATGIYSFAYNIGIIISVVAISLEQAWLPWFFQKFKEGKYESIKNRALIYRNAFVFIYILVLMVSTELVKFMANESYWSGLEILPWIFMAYYFQFMYAFEVNVEYALKKTVLIPIGTVLSAIVNIVLNIIFIPRYGYVAAAITTVISYFLMFLFHFLMTTQVLKRNIYGLKFHLQSVLYLIIITFIFIVFKDLLILRVFVMIIAALLLYKSFKRLMILNN